MKARDGRNASRIRVRIEVNGVNVYKTIRRRYDPVFLSLDFITTLKRNEFAHRGTSHVRPTLLPAPILPPP